MAQCYELYQVPPLGSLVRTGDIYGVVAGAETTSLEPNRRPIARGRDEASEEAVYSENPQLAKLLRSEFRVVVTGYREGDRLYQYLPPGPARIHGFVYRCTPDEIRGFSQSFDFLNVLANAREAVPQDELIAATLRRLGQVSEDPHAFLVAAGKELAVLLSNDYIQLKSILRRLQ